MQLTDIGESRIRGYLFVLDRSLRSFLPREVAADAVREVESHIRERIAQAEAPAAGASNGGMTQPGAGERAVVERILAELGEPLRVARAYSTEMTIDEAVTTGRFVPIMRAVWHLATTSVLGFVWAMFLFIGWTFGLSFVAIGAVKIVAPNNVGVFLRDGHVTNVGAIFNAQPGTVVYPFGYWIVPLSILAGLAVLVGTQRLSQRFLSWLRSRRSPATFRIRLEVQER